MFDFIGGFGASQMVHFSVAVPGFCNMHKSQVQAGPLTGMTGFIATLGAGFGASHIVHFSVAVAGFCSMHRSHVHGDAGGEAGASVKVKTSMGWARAASLADLYLSSLLIVGRVKV